MRIEMIMTLPKKIDGCFDWVTATPMDYLPPIGSTVRFRNDLAVKIVDEPEWDVAKGYASVAVEFQIAVSDWRAALVDCGFSPNRVVKETELQLNPLAEPWAKLLDVMPQSETGWWVRWTDASGIYWWLNVDTNTWVSEPDQIDLPMFSSQGDAMNTAAKSPEPPTWPEYYAKHIQPNDEASCEISADDERAIDTLITRLTLIQNARHAGRNIAMAIDCFKHGLACLHRHVDARLNAGIEEAEENIKVPEQK